MTNWFFGARPALLLAFGGLAIASIQCGGKRPLGVSGAAGVAGTTMGGGNPGTAGTGTNGGTAGTDGGSADASGGTTGIQGGSSGAGAGSSGGAGGDGTGCNSPTGGTGGWGGAIASGWKNYEVSGSFPSAPIAVVQKPGQLKFTKIVIQDQFLAESCAIGDYNGDGIPDVSSGRIWYEGTNDPTTTFMTQHPFRDGHGSLPRAGAPIELNTGVSDDWADYPWDMDGDGDTDIIDIAQPEVPEDHASTLPQAGLSSDPQAAGTPNKIGTVQVHATAVWYENPGKAAETQTTNWTAHLMHSDVRMEQHEMVDMNGDGYPEILGACRDCGMGDTKGYYQGNPMSPTCPWTYHQVTGFFSFYGANLGYLHGIGAGDVNGDGLPDWFDRTGAYLQQPGGMWNLTPCTGKNTPAGCGVIKGGTSLLPPVNGQMYGGFYDGFPDGFDDKGPSHMFAADMDMDGCADIVAADWAHGMGLAWYQQGKDASGCNYDFSKKFYFMGNAPFTAKYKMNQPAIAAVGQATMWGGVGFTEPHALQVYDMDGDGRPDVITGKFRFAFPYDLGDPDPDGVPYIYVFKNVATPDSRTGAPITLQPFLVDGDPNAMEGTTDAGMGVGRQIAIGHVNTDGIMDICVATKLGLAVFLGQ
jgi:hypothetical protein